MKFSTSAIALVASLALAEQTEQYYDNRYSVSGIDQSLYQWPQSDYVYQMAAQRDNRNIAMRTDGRNLYFGDAQNVNGAPLRDVNVFVDIAGDLNIAGPDANSARYVGVDNGRLALSTRRNNNFNLQRTSDDRVSWRYNNQNQFHACPVDQYGNTYDINSNQRAQDHLYQVYAGSAACGNPIAVSLNGNRQNGNARYQDSQLRITNNQRFRDSQIVQNNGQLMLVDNRNQGNYDQFRGQLSYRGQLVDNQGRFVQLGNQASMRFTDRNQVRNGLTGFSYRNNQLTYQNQGFIACQVQNGMWELRPTAVEAAAASCSNPQYVEISMEPLN